MIDWPPSTGNRKLVIHLTLTAVVLTALLSVTSTRLGEIESHRLAFHAAQDSAISSEFVVSIRQNPVRNLNRTTLARKTHYQISETQFARL